MTRTSLLENIVTASVETGSCYDAPRLVVTNAPAEEDQLVEDAAIAVGVLEVIYCSRGGLMSRT